MRTKAFIHNRRSQLFPNGNLTKMNLSIMGLSYLCAAINCLEPKADDLRIGKDAGMDTLRKWIRASWTVRITFKAPDGEKVSCLPSAKCMKCPLSSRTDACFFAPSLRETWMSLNVKV